MPFVINILISMIHCRKLIEKENNTYAILYYVVESVIEKICVKLLILL